MLGGVGQALELIPQECCEGLVYPHFGKHIRDDSQFCACQVAVLNWY